MFHIEWWAILRLFLDEGSKRRRRIDFTSSESHPKLGQLWMNGKWRWISVCLALFPFFFFFYAISTSRASAGFDWQVNSHWMRWFYRYIHETVECWGFTVLSWNGLFVCKLRQLLRCERTFWKREFWISN